MASTDTVGRRAASHRSRPSLGLSNDWHSAAEPPEGLRWPRVEGLKNGRPQGVHAIGTRQTQNWAGSRFEPRQLPSEATTWHRADIVLRRPCDEFLIDSSELSQFARPEAVNANLGRSAQEDDEVERILEIGAPTIDRTGENKGAIAAQPLTKKHRTFGGIALHFERRVRGQPEQVVGIDEGCLESRRKRSTEGAGSRA
jgi:hypothetical protein